MESAAGILSSSPQSEVASPLVESSDQQDWLHFDVATLRDLPEIVRVEQLAWPAGENMRAETKKFACRVEYGGVLIARDRRSGKIVGFLSTFRPSWANADTLGSILQACSDHFFSLNPERRWQAMHRYYGLPSNWSNATDDGTLEEGRMHNPSGNVLFGIGISTDPSAQKLGVAKSLLKNALARAEQDGVEYFMAYSRLPGFYKHSSLSVDEYMRLAVHHHERLLPLDFGFRMHWSVGAKPVQTESGRTYYVPVPQSMNDDPESLNSGILIINPIHDRSVYPFESVHSFCEKIGDSVIFDGTPEIPGRVRISEIEPLNHIK